MDGRKKILECTIPSHLEQLNCIERLTAQAAEQLRLSEDQQDNLAIAVTEAVGNAIVHGNKKDPEKKVTIRFQLKPDSVHVTVKDEGHGFDPDQIANPLDQGNLMKESGRGIFILRKLMDKVTFDFTPGGTIIHLTMKIH